METQAVPLGVTRGGRTWAPRFVQAIDREKCIGCGRCFKVCGRDVLALMGVDEDGELVALDAGEDEEIEKKVMAVARAEDCIGCEACARICPKKCYSHAP
ncbi:MAG: ferredoxin III, nif-specific [Nitrospirae bacterium]|nr:ferredoxin III, nif-specific [Nitrospirota bacterium]MBI3392039.1 ferredoxin III, nif-specific [Nitrospirota bacterium]